MDASAARSEGQRLVDDLRALDDEAVTWTGTPSSVECGPHETEGVEFHWASEGAAPPDPQNFIARAYTVMRDAGFSVEQSTRELHDGRPLYLVAGASDSGAQVSLGSSAVNTVLQVSSACADGSAADYD